MEAKTLMRLIKDDIAHLEEITGDFLMESLPASDEVELALVRAKALLRELELLYKLALQHENIYAAVKRSEGTNIELQEHYHSEQEPFELSASRNIDDELGNTLIHGQQDLLLAQIVSDHEVNIEEENNTEAVSDVLMNNTPAEEHFTALVEPAESVVVEHINSIDEEEVADEDHFTALVEPSESVDVAPVNPIIEEEVDENISIDESDNFEPLIEIEDEIADLPTTDIQSNEAITYNVEEPIDNLEEVTIDKVDAAEESVVTIEVEAIQDIPEQSEEILAEEFKEVKKTLNETLGESNQGDSHLMVNDILSPEKDETEYKIIPINSIWDGIGINDRFLFIRELFANSSAKLENTVTALDKLATIQDAVTYLKMNFKWNKTEASQKFLVLVKRRFTK